MNVRELKKVCRSYGINNYVINSDGSIDVNGNVNLRSMDLERLPVRFRNVSGHFWCSENRLVSLAGSPSYVGGDFVCSFNRLTSLEGGPIETNNYIASHNELISLEGGPKVARTFICSFNRLSSLDGIGNSIFSGHFDCSSNNIISLESYPSVKHTFMYFTNPIYLVLGYFISETKCEFSMDLLEYFNDCDIIRGNEIIKDRLRYFYGGYCDIERVDGFISNLVRFGSKYKLID